MTMTSMRVASGRGRRVWVATCGIFAAATIGGHPVAAGADPYPAMAPIAQYMVATRADEIALAKSAAPASVADQASVMVLSAHGYETAVKGTNGFVCFVGRSWDQSFASPEFWNPKVRTPQCDNATSARSVLPRYLMRTERVLASMPKPEMQKREAADWTSGALKAPESGAMCYMLSKSGYINDSAGGAWHPHVMFFTPRTEDAAWGANLPGSPVASDSTSYDHTTIFFVIVPSWSDGTPAPMHK